MATPIESIEITPSRVTLAILGEIQLRATPNNVAWSSENTLVATVMGDGTVTAGAMTGQTVVVAALGDRRGYAVITVIEPQPVAARVEIDSTSREAAEEPLVAGELIKLNVVAVDSSGQPVTVSWRSDDPITATVLQDGTVTAKRRGSARIIAAAGGLSDTIEVSVAPTFASASIGAFHTCGIATDGVAFCWGRAEQGQIGDGGQSGRLAPAAVLVSGGLRFEQLGAGEHHTCGITADSATWCWGSNASGQLGDGDVGTTQNIRTAVVWGGVFESLVVGAQHSCAVTRGRDVHCWGSNGVGQLGSGSAIQSLVPSRVPPFVAFSAGVGYTCGVVVDGRGFCWGNNSGSQLGGGDISNQDLPNPLLTNERFRVVATGEFHSCALTFDNRLFCWGTNDRSQLGETDPKPVIRPKRVLFGFAFTSLVLGRRHSCGIDATGTTYCWGSDAAGQLGDGQIGGQTAVPQQVNVPGAGAFQQIDAGDFHTCGVTIDGIVYCWGINNSGQVGDGNWTANVPVSSPVMIAAPDPTTRFSSVATGGAHSCAVTVDGEVYCWGRAYAGQLGLGSDLGAPPHEPCEGGNICVPSPSLVPQSGVVESITAGKNHTCARITDSEIYCWGRGDLGQLAAPAATPCAAVGGSQELSELCSFTPQRSFVEEFVILSARGDHTCGLTGGGSLYCWGLGSSGQIGNGQVGGADRPALVSAPQQFAFLEVAAGGSHTCGRSTSALLLCWGGNAKGQLGLGNLSDQLLPVFVDTVMLGSVMQISAGGEHTCAVNGGALYCWGDNGMGQLGEGSTQSTSSPVGVTDVFGGASLAFVSAGWQHTCATTVVGAAFCWGGNANGQLGDGTEGGFSVQPSPVLGGATFGWIGAGHNHSCGLTTSPVQGVLLCWGTNDFGQLGDGSTGSSLVPTRVTAPN